VFRVRARDSRSDGALTFARCGAAFLQLIGAQKPFAARQALNIVLRRNISRVNCCIAQSCGGERGRHDMFKAVVRLIEALMAPRAQLLASMPPSAVRQAIFSI
jgi:hypothetical protein